MSTLSKFQISTSSPTTDKNSTNEGIVYTHEKLVWMQDENLKYYTDYSSNLTVDMDTCINVFVL